MTRGSSIFVLSLAAACCVGAGTVPEGGQCSTNHDHLHPVSHKFVSQCTDTTFCSAEARTNATIAGAGAASDENGSCRPRLCRRDEFPFGYAPDDKLPPLCLPGEFCPDEGSGCRSVLPPGAACQFGRDEQCGSSSDAVLGAWGSSERIFRVDEDRGPDEVLCLLSTCTPANISFDQPCIFENTTYTDFGPDGLLFEYNVYRDNCRPPMYFCGPSTQRCQRKKPLGVQCEFDVECESFNCLLSVCTRSPETPNHVAPWQYAVTVLCITGTMTATFVILMILHNRHRARRYQEVREYYAEQVRLRHAIISLHEAAAGVLDTTIVHKN